MVECCRDQEVAEKRPEFDAKRRVPLILPFPSWLFQTKGFFLLQSRASLGVPDDVGSGTWGQGIFGCGGVYESSSIRFQCRYQGYMAACHEHLQCSVSTVLPFLCRLSSSQGEPRRIEPTSQGVTMCNSLATSPVCVKHSKASATTMCLLYRGNVRPSNFRPPSPTSLDCHDYSLDIPCHWDDSLCCTSPRHA